MLENANYIYLDDTFSVVPELYFQLYTIHGTHLNDILLAVYILIITRYAPTRVSFLKQFFISSLCCLGKNKVYIKKDCKK